MALLVLVLLAMGCGDADNGVETTQGNGNSSASGGMSSGVAYTGETSMEEALAYADAVARVRYRSARQTIEEIRLQIRNADWHHTFYANSIEITFEVLEYLRGSGGDEIKAVLYDQDGWQETRAEVEALNENLLPLRNTQWDEREAIVFLRSSDHVVSTYNDPDRYWLTSFRNNGEDGYTVGSRWVKAWLPDAAAPGARGRASGGDQRFLINLPGGSQGASGQRSTQGESMTISDLKALVTRIGDELAAGGTEAYAECVKDKYSSAGYDQYLKNHRETVWGVEYNEQHVKVITSGAPAGTEVYVDRASAHKNVDEIPDSLDIDDVILHTGQDADLFDKAWPGNAVTARPLPQGTYRFYWASQPKNFALCDAISELRKNRHEVIVTVTPPENTLHEAFFDPVTIGTGVGADSSNGVLKPAGFTVDGTSTSITSLKYDNSKVVLTLSTHVSLTGQKVEFIELDGSVGLALEVSSATEDSTAGTLTWSVSEEPWEDGDELMVQIAASTAGPTATATPEPTATPAPTPTPEPTATPALTPTPEPASAVTVTLNPRVTTYVTHTDITVDWTDSLSCQGSYFVAVFDSSASAVRILGFPSAPATTTLTADLGLHWDTVPNFDWTVGVRCDPSDYSINSWMVGEVALQSGLPTTP